MPSRQITDNTVIVQEAIHSLKKIDKKGDMIIKIDMKKTYAKLEWSLPILIFLIVRSAYPSLHC